MKPDWQRIPGYGSDHSVAPFDGEPVLIWKCCFRSRTSTSGVFDAVKAFSLMFLTPIGVDADDFPVFTGFNRVVFQAFPHVDPAGR